MLKYQIWNIILPLKSRYRHGKWDKRIISYFIFLNQNKLELNENTQVIIGESSQISLVEDRGIFNYWSHERIIYLN